MNYYGSEERASYNAYITEVPKWRRALLILLQPGQWLKAYSFNKVACELIRRNHHNADNILWLSDQLWRELYVGYTGIKKQLPVKGVSDSAMYEVANHLYNEDNMGVKDIAEYLGVTISTVKNLVKEG